MTVKQQRKRYIGRLFWLLCGLLVLAGCTPSENPPTTESSIPPPLISNPIDISPYVASPCPAAVQVVKVKYHLANQKEYRDRFTLPRYNGPQPACELYNVYGEQPALEFRFYPTVRPLPLLAGQANALPPTQVGQYPAGVLRLDNGPGTFTSCTIYVDVGSNQGMSTLYNGPAGEKTDGCELARQATDLLLANLSK